MTSTAASQVFDTVELLEMILLQVCTSDSEYTWKSIQEESRSIRTLFVIQRVSKTFKTTMKGSIRLRRAMFLERDPAREMHDEHDDYGGKRVNPLFESIRFRTSTGCIIHVNWAGDDYPEEQCAYPQIQYNGEQRAFKNQALSIRNQSASWKSMLIAQGPPIEWRMMPHWDEDTQVWDDLS